MEVQDRMRNWYGHIVRRALRTKNDDGNVRKRGMPKIRWLDGVRVIPKRRECTTELHIVEHRLAQSGTKMKMILADEDDLP